MRVEDVNKKPVGSPKSAPKKKGALDASQVNLTATTGDVDLSVTALLGPNGAVPSEGYGGWTVVDRPRATGLTFWQGASPFQMSLQIVLDDFIGQGSVDDDCSRIERMSMPPTKDDVPPVIDLDGAAVPKTTLRWIIQDIAWEDVERRADGKRTRQVLTLTLRQFVTNAGLKASQRAKRTAKLKKVKAGSVEDRHNQFLGR